MTEKEIAEEYANNEINKMFVDESEEVYVRASTLKQIIKNSHLKGLAEGKDMAEADLATIAYMHGAERYKTKWHDLRKDPNDLPLNTAPVLCLGSTGFIVCKYISGSWVDNQTIKLVPKYIDIYKWCEIEDTEE